MLFGFVKFVVVEIGFGGFTQTRSARELLFGYEDPFLKTLHDLDPMQGGDRSLQTLVMINDPNSTLENASQSQSMWTGYSDPVLTRNFISNYNYDYVTFNKTYYIFDLD